MSDILIPFKGIRPTVKEEVLLARGAIVLGNVTLEKGVSVWYNSILRGDMNSLSIGEYTNIQDGSVVHCEYNYACSIGKYVTIGHKAVLDGCMIGDYCLIGMGAIVLDGAEIGEGSIIGAGAVVKGDAKIPPFSVVVGTPAKIIRTADPSSKEDRIAHALKYYKLAQEHRQLAVLE